MRMRYPKAGEVGSKYLVDTYRRPLILCKCAVEESTVKVPVAECLSTKPGTRVALFTVPASKSDGKQS